MKVAAHVGLTWAWRRRASVSDLGGERGGAASSGGRARALDRWSTHYEISRDPRREN